MVFPHSPPSLDDKCSDLLKRVGEFLPQIERANEGMLLLVKYCLSERRKTNLMLSCLDLDASAEHLDATLVEDKGEESDTDESESPIAPTIELKVALGKLDDNPAIALLADEDNETEEEKEVSDSVKSQGVVSEMLKASDEKNVKKRKVLIEDLS